MSSFADRHDDEEIFRADGLDEACVGWSDSWNGNERNIRLVYDIAKVIDILQERDGMEYEDAVEFFAKLGFVNQGEITTPQTTPIRHFLMIKPIAPSSECAHIKITD